MKCVYVMSEAESLVFHATRSRLGADSMTAGARRSGQSASRGSVSTQRSDASACTSAIDGPSTEEEEEETIALR